MAADSFIWGSSQVVLQKPKSAVLPSLLTVRQDSDSMLLFVLFFSLDFSPGSLDRLSVRYSPLGIHLVNCPMSPPGVHQHLGRGDLRISAFWVSIPITITAWTLVLSLFLEPSLCHWCPVSPWILILVVGSRCVPLAWMHQGELFGILVPSLVRSCLPTCHDTPSPMLPVSPNPG